MSGVESNAQACRDVKRKNPLISPEVRVTNDEAHQRVSLAL